MVVDVILVAAIMQQGKMDVVSGWCNAFILKCVYVSLSFFLSLKRLLVVHIYVCISLLFFFFTWLFFSVLIRQKVERRE